MIAYLISYAIFRHVHTCTVGLCHNGGIAINGSWSHPVSATLVNGEDRGLFHLYYFPAWIEKILLGRECRLINPDGYFISAV